MRPLRRGGPLLAAAQVAAVTTTVAAIVYGVAAVAVLMFVRQTVVSSIDTQLTDTMSLIGNSQDVSRVTGAYVWVLYPDGSVVTNANAPPLPASLNHVNGATSASIQGVSYRLTGQPRTILTINAPPQRGWLVVGVQTTWVDRGMISLGIGEFVIAFPILIVVFLVALLIGARSAAPIEHARQQLLNFTADASHELRTPLQVIEAEVSLALQRERPAAAYRATIERVQAESGRLRRLVDDLLWLARFENQPQAPSNDLVDLRAVASDAVERFEAVAQRRDQAIALQGESGPPAMISAPSSWVERLVGVLVDNACRYSPEGGRIVVSVEVANGRARLAVEDSGPGIPPEERRAIFERFHRATDKPGGAGLGLAIANAVVVATGGRWEIGDAQSGGARVAVSWEQARRPRGERRGEPEQPAA